MRFSTLPRICDILGCRPGDLITHGPAAPGSPAGDSGQ
ncbi:helix-turn-helix domain-containing protein [Streptomyces brevispora]